MGYRRHSKWILIATMLAISCAPSDDDRCLDGYYYENKTCNKIEEESTDSGGDGGVLSGLGDACGDSEACAGQDADFCALNPTKPGQEGYCTVKDCAGSPDSCPAGYDCCFNLDYCLKTDDKAAMPGSVCGGA